MNFPAKEQRKNQQNGEREGQTDQPGGEREHRLVVVQLERRAEIAAQRGGKGDEHRGGEKDEQRLGRRQRDRFQIEQQEEQQGGEQQRVDGKLKAAAGQRADSDERRDAQSAECGELFERQAQKAGKRQIAQQRERTADGQLGGIAGEKHGC